MKISADFWSVSGTQFSVRSAVYLASSVGWILERGGALEAGLEHSVERGGGA